PTFQCRSYTGHLLGSEPRYFAQVCRQPVAGKRIYCATHGRGQWQERRLSGGVRGRGAGYPSYIRGRTAQARHHVQNEKHGPLVYRRARSRNREGSLPRRAWALRISGEPTWRSVPYSSFKISTAITVPKSISEDKNARWSKPPRSRRA